MDRLDPVKAPPPITRSPATRRERRRPQDELPGGERRKEKDGTDDDRENEHTIDEYV